MHAALIVSVLFAALSAPAAPSPTTQRIAQVDNEAVVAWKTIILPNQPLKMHRHDRNRMLVALKGGTLTKVERDGRRSALVFETGKSYWLPADPPGDEHADLNEGSEAVEVIVIELKHSAQAK